jgi:antitoxin HicB
LVFIEREMKMNKKNKFNLKNVDTDLFEAELEIEELDVDEDIEKIVQEYLELEYPINLYRDEDEKGPYWVAEHPDLPGCKTHGESKEEALKNLEEAKKSWMYSYADLGKEIPKPNQLNEIDNCSGKILLRIPKELHYKLITKAKNDGISLNQEILYLLSASFGKTSMESHFDVINKKLDKLLHDRKQEDKINEFYGTINETLNHLLVIEKKTHKVKGMLNIEKIFGGMHEKPDRSKTKNFTFTEEYAKPFIQ